MDGPERSATAHAAGAAIARVTRAVAGTHAVLADATHAAMAPLGPAGQLPVRMAAQMAAAQFATVEFAALGVAALAAPVAGATAAPDAVPASSRPPAVAWLAALGGAFGDKLVANHRVRALTVPMSVREQGALVEVPGRDDVRLDVHPTVVVLVHGLGNHESMWGQAHLAAVRQRNATALTVRYTTGQPIADSGAELAALLADLVATWPVEVTRLVLVGHSMGGLVIRAALGTDPDLTAPDAPDRAEPAWRALVSDVVTLGTPHAGAPLERVAARSLALVSTFPVAAPIAALGDERSAGIKDLARAEVPAAGPGPTWHLVAATLREPNPKGALARTRSAARGLFGDGLVTLGSAFAVDDELVGHRLVIEGADHLALLGHEDAAELVGRVLDAG